MAIARPGPKYVPPTTYPAVFEFHILLYFLSAKDLSLACDVSKAWAKAIDDITLCKIMMSYNKDKDKNTLDYHLLCHLLEAIKSQHIQSVHLLIALGVNVNKCYENRFYIVRSTDTSEKKWYWDGDREESVWKIPKNYLKRFTPLAVASIVASGQKGANIIQILLDNQANIFESSKLFYYSDYDGRCIISQDFYPGSLPSEFRVNSDSTINAFLYLTRLEKLRQLPEYRLNCGEMCGLILVGLVIIGGIIGMFIIMPLLVTILLGSIALLTVASYMRDSWANYQIRKNFHKLLSTESTKPPETVKFSGGLFSQLQAAPQCKPPIHEVRETPALLYQRL